MSKRIAASLFCLILAVSQAMAGTGTLTVLDSTGATQTYQIITNGAGHYVGMFGLCDGVAAAQCVAVKAASTAAGATDPALVVAISPNNTVGVTGTFWQTTQPVSAASLPLPTGAATSALQSTINTTLGSPFQAGGSIGNTTFAATESGTWTVQPGNTANTTPWLITGSGTAGAAAAGVFTVQGVASMTPVQVSQATAANLNATVVGTGTLATQLTGATNNINNIAGTITLPTGAATSANQTNASQKTQIVDGSGNVIASTSNNLDVQCANCSGSGVSTADGATWTVGTSLFAGIGGFYQTTPTSNPLTTGHQGFAQLTVNRALFTDWFNSSGVEMGTSGSPVQVSLANTGANGTAVAVSLASIPTGAVTQSGTWTVQPGNTANTTPWLVTSRVVGNAGAIMDFAGQNASSPANALLIGGQFQTTPTTITPGNSSPFQLDNAGNLLVNVKAGGGAGGTSAADAATWTAGTTAQTAIGCEFTTGGATALVTAHFGTVGCTAARGVFTDKSSVAGTALVAAVSAYGTAPTGTEVEGVNAFVTNTNANGQTTMSASSPVTIASDQSAVATKAASGAFASGSIASGALAAGSISSGAAVSGAFASGAVVDLTNIEGVIGNATAPTKMAVGGVVYNSTPLTLTNGQSSALQGDANGYLNVHIQAGGGSGGTSSTFGSAFPSIGTAIGLSNGTNMVAWTLGSAVSASSAPVVIASDQGAIATKVASGQIASGALASGSIASGAIASGAIASGAAVSGAFVAGAIADLAHGQGTMSASVPVAIASNQSTLPANTAQVNGVTTLTGAGATGTGAQRVTAAQDTTTIAGSAPGTAGSASANVVTVQGVASMTPVLANPGTAANWGVGATGAAPPANAVQMGVTQSGATGGFTKALISCDNHLFKHITTATDTLAVQGVASQTIYICGWRSRAAGTATWYLENTASVNANCASTLTQITGLASEVANSGEVAYNPIWGGLKNTSANGLCINSTGTGGVDVDIWYTQL